MAAAAQRQSTEPVAHSILANHCADDCGNALQIVARAGGHFAVNDFLGDAAGEKRGYVIHQFLFADQIFIAYRKLPSASKRHAARENRDLMHGVCVFQ